MTSVASSGPSRRWSSHSTISMRASRPYLEFHRALALATQNDLFVALHDSIGETLVEVRRRKLARNVAQRRHCAAAHRAILGAVVAHDAPAAREAMRAHLRDLHAEWTTGSVTA